jgi:hypothetical protein
MELSAMEQRYQAVLLMIRDGESIVDVTRCFDVPWVLFDFVC